MQHAHGATPIHIVAFGDSLTAGYGLADKDGFVPRLQAALAKNGIAADVANAGVSGNTASDGLARLDWSVPQGTDAVIVELGANDMLRGIEPEVTRAALDSILQRLTARHIAVLLCGMRAAPNMGTDYGRDFERIYPELAAKGIPATGFPFLKTGPVVTAGGLVFTATRDHKVRAYDVETGKVLWEKRLDTGLQGIPSVYEVGGREYLVVCAAAPEMSDSASQGSIHGAYVAFALPSDSK